MLSRIPESRRIVQRLFRLRIHCFLLSTPNPNTRHATFSSVGRPGATPQPRFEGSKLGSAEHNHHTRILDYLPCLIHPKRFCRYPLNSVGPLWLVNLTFLFFSSHKLATFLKVGDVDLDCEEPYLIFGHQKQLEVHAFVNSM
jgi:hypothetical protein